MVRRDGEGRSETKRNKHWSVALRGWKKYSELSPSQSGTPNESNQNASESGRQSDKIVSAGAGMVEYKRVQVAACKGSE